MRGIIDRFEGDWVVIEINGVTRDFQRNKLPKEAAVGDIVEIKDNSVKILKEETKKRRADIEALMAEVWEEE